MDGETKAILLVMEKQLRELTLAVTFADEVGDGRIVLNRPDHKKMEAYLEELEIRLHRKVPRGRREVVISKKELLETIHELQNKE